LGKSDIAYQVNQTKFSGNYSAHGWRWCSKGNRVVTFYEKSTFLVCVILTMLDIATPREKHPWFTMTSIVIVFETKYFSHSQLFI
jgi:hypothetical protein